MKEVLNILRNGTPSEIKALFLFDRETGPELLRRKFLIWSHEFFPKFFESADSVYHKRLDDGNISVYIGREPDFLDIAFRGFAKTTRTKLFVAFCIANDTSHYRRYFKVLSKDTANSKQTVTDVYNLLVSRRVKALYPEIFEKTDAKREERMESFTTATGVKMVADSVGTDQRGDIQDDARPDFIWFDDFETKLSLMSAATTFKIWQNMQEAINGLSKTGACVFTCNYISERGNVHKLVEKVKHQLIVPIADRWPGGVISWPERYTPEDVQRIFQSAEDFEGEFMCRPSAGKDVYFDRESVDRQTVKQPIDEIAGQKIYRRYDPSHRTAAGADVAGGVGLDSSTSVFWDFDCFPAQVIATYKNNEIKPDEFAYELAKQGKRYGECYLAPEKNYGSTVDVLKRIYPTNKIHKTDRNNVRVVFQNSTEYGWDTNEVTKHTMLSDLANAIESGMAELNDPDLIAEVRAYTRNDLMDKEVDPRLTTRHWDLLMAAAIGFQMRKYVRYAEREPENDIYGVPVTFSREPENPAI